MKNGGGRSEGLLRLRVTAAAQAAVRGGHPWVYSDSVLEMSRAGTPGELGVIYDKNDRFLAVGLCDPEGPIILRVLHSGKPAKLDDAWWVERFRTAVGRREGLFDESTTGYRLIYGESDGWPGLVLDKYASTLVLKLYTSAWLPRLEMVTSLIRAHLDSERLVLRLSRNIQSAAYTGHGLSDGQVLAGEMPIGPVQFLENGLIFEAEVIRGQKTGFFLDQRENRRLLGETSAGKSVLNTFSFSAGFSLYAARGGARQVTDVDISAHALDSGARNFALNAHVPSVRACNRAATKADVFEWLQAARDLFDVVVLDPPSLARREAERMPAIVAYERLAGLATARLKPGGLLLACSCSAHVSTPEFHAAVRAGLKLSGRSWAEIRATGHPPDHEPRFREAEYLKALWVRVS